MANELKRPDFVDARERHRTYGASFSCPSDEDCAKIKVGDFVKVCLEWPTPVDGCHGERFWLEVVELEPLVGVVCNQIEDRLACQYNDCVVFEYRHVFDISTGPED